MVFCVSVIFALITKKTLGSRILRLRVVPLLYRMCNTATRVPDPSQLSPCENRNSDFLGSVDYKIFNAMM